MIATEEALITSSVLVALAGGLRFLTGTWLHPAAFFPLFWCFAGIAPLLFAYRDPVGANAVVWLIAASLAVASGAVAGNGGFRTVRRAVPVIPTRMELNVLSGVLALSIPLGITSSVAFLKGNSVPLADLLDIEKLIVVANHAYFIRYAESGPPAPPFWSRALLPFVYLAPALGGILFELRRELRWKMVALAGFLPAILVTIIQTTKAATLFAICFWLSGYFAARLRRGRLAVFTSGHVLVALALGCALGGFLFAVQFARLATIDASLSGLVARKLITAAFGHMTGLSQWLTDYWVEPFSPTLGSYTFAGPLEMLGYTQRIPGIYSTLIEMATGETTNIYTAFRPLIEDYTIPGALAVLAVLGFAGGVGFRLVAAGHMTAIPLLLIVYATTLWTPVTWIWLYNSLTATVLSVFLLILLIRLIRGTVLSHPVVRPS